MTKKTNWFPRDIRPVRSGWYECLHLGFVDAIFQYYCHPSRSWRPNEFFFYPLRTDIHYASPFMWRGLTKEAK